MNKYFKFPVESKLGIGIQYIEFDNDNWPIRQVEFYGDRCFNSQQRYHSELGGMGLCDQQLTEPDLEIADIVDAEEFELVWIRSIDKPLESLLIVENKAPVKN
jgi:hypothetical protein